MRRFVVLAIAGSVGCTYPEFHFTREDAAVVDSVVVVSDSTTDSFAADTSASDTLVADTAMMDTRMDVLPDVPLSTGCTGVVAKHCFDWDKSTKPEDGFSFFGVDPPGTIAIESGGGRSPLNAFLATTAPGTGPVVTANLTQLITVAANDTLIKLDGWIKLDTAKYPGTDGAFLFKVQRNGGSGDGVTFSLDASGFYVDRIGLTYEYFAIATAPKVSTWMHIRMHTKIHTAAGSITLWIDNMSTPVFTRTGISTCKEDSTSKSVIVGLYSQQATGPLKVRYDDVVIDY